MADLEIKQIIPIWYKRIEDWPQLRKSQKKKYAHILHADGQYCLVGEAHKHTSEYIGSSYFDIEKGEHVKNPNFCSMCCAFAGSRIPKQFTYDGIIRNENRLKNTLNSFAKHWNKRHRNK